MRYLYSLEKNKKEDPQSRSPHMQNIPMVSMITTGYKKTDVVKTLCFPRKYEAKSLILLAGCSKISFAVPFLRSWA